VSVANVYIATIEELIRESPRIAFIRFRYGDPLL
jgi:hypothetical protein